MVKNEIEKSTKVTDFPTNTENPFLKQVVEEVQGHIIKRSQMSTGSTKKAILQAVDPETGESVGYTSFVRQIEVDDDKFTKVYASNLQAFFNLSKTGVRVLAYVFTCMHISRDTILFDIDEAMKYTGYKAHRSVYDGLAELLKAEIIARGKKDNIYYINPMIIFNGNRINFIRQYVKKSEAQKPLIEDQKSLTEAQQKFFEHAANEDTEACLREQGREDAQAEEQRPEMWTDLPDNDPAFQAYIEDARQKWMKGRRPVEQDWTKPNLSAKPIPFKNKK